MHFPVMPGQIALEYTKQRFKESCISDIRGEAVGRIEGALLKSKVHPHWYILYAPRPKLPGRENFTIAHELGHYLYHRKSDEGFECGQEDVLDEDGYRHRKREQEANTFASYLLMPMNDFREQVAGHAISLDLLGHCANRYRVSFTAAALKWIEFTPAVAMLVVATDGFALWSRPSQRAKEKHLWWKSGRPLPPHSVIAQPDGARRPDPVTHPPGVWSYFDETVEMAILSDEYDFQIALILYPDTSSPSHYDPESRDAYDFISSRAR